MGRAGSAIVEQKMIVDDSMLPPAEELAKLQEVKPELVDWVMARAEKEQEARIDFNRKRLLLAERDLKGTQWTNILCLVFAFLIIVAGLGTTIYLLMNDKDLAGTICAGGTVVAAAALFTRIPKREKSDEK